MARKGVPAENSEATSDGIFSLRKNGKISEVNRVQQTVRKPLPQGTTLKRHRNSTKKSGSQKKKKLKARGKAGTPSTSLDPKPTDDDDPVSDTASDNESILSDTQKEPDGMDDLFGLIARANVVTSEKRPVSNSSINGLNAVHRV